MMAHLQKRTLQARLCQHGLFNRSLRISFEQNRRAAVCDVQYQRVVVGRLSAGFVSFDGRKNGYAGVRERKCVPLAHRTNWYV